MSEEVRVNTRVFAEERQLQTVVRRREGRASARLEARARDLHR